MLPIRNTRWKASDKHENTDGVSDVISLYNKFIKFFKVFSTNFSTWTLSTRCTENIGDAITATRVFRARWGPKEEIDLSEGISRGSLPCENSWIKDSLPIVNAINQNWLPRPFHKQNKP